MTLDQTYEIELFAMDTLFEGPLKNFSICRFEHKGVSLQAEGEFASRQERVNRNFGEKSTPSYSVYHLRATYNWELKRTGIEFSTGIENIFNRAYNEHLDWGHYLRPGRNIYLNLSVRI